MIKLKSALKIIVDFLENKTIPYMIFGGVANSLYGYSRQTFDIDVKIILDMDKEWLNLYSGIKQIGKILPDSPKDFFLDTKVLPIEVDKVRVDLVLANLPYETIAVKNSILSTLYGVKCRVCKPEDLIIQKSISERQKDWIDIAEIIKIQKNNMDWDYIFKNCEQISGFLSDTTIIEKIRKLSDEE